jgi:opacity protein-like surface antigen
MGSLKVYAGLAGFLAMAASTMTAHAADLLPPPPMPEPVEFDTSGWYLRGDVGVGLLDFRRTDAFDRSSPPAPYDYARIQDHIGDQVFVGAGVGYQFNSWLRFDVTGEYRTQTDWRFVAEDRTGGAAGGFDLLTGKFSSVVGLANVYFDLGHWYGFTPFIGGGVGVAHHMFGSVTDEGLGLYTGGASGVAGGFGYAAPRDKTNFAWALHAGVGYDVSPNLKLEVAYRYLNMGDVRTGTVACIPGCGLLTDYRLREVQSHDFKIGMRWMFAEPAPAPEMPPLIRKY